MRFFALTMLAILSLSIGCSSGANDDPASASSDVTDGALVGSWTVEKEGPLELSIPHVPFKTVASLVLRQDGTYFAQLAPRNVPGERYVDDSQMNGLPEGTEITGGWQGLSGKWSVRSESRELVLSRESAEAPNFPALVLAFTLTNGELALTDPSYAGRVADKTDRLRRLTEDCRLDAVQKTSAEIEVDAIETAIYGFGASKHAPGGMTIDLEGDERLDDPACTKRVKESVLRETRKDPSGRIRALSVTLSDLGDERVSTTTVQRYVYDVAGKLRLVVTTIERQDLGGEAVKDVGGTTLTEARTYYDATGNAGRTLVQPKLEQAQVLDAELQLVGRRFTSLPYPTQVIDLPSCVERAPALIASAPNDPSASVAATPICRDR